MLVTSTSAGRSGSAPSTETRSASASESGLPSIAVVEWALA